VRGPPPRHPDDQREQLPPVEGVITDPAELAVGERVVYPNQGVCKVIGMEEKDISGQKLTFLHLQFEEGGAAVLVPRNKVPTIGLRRVATGEQIEGVFHYLAAVFDDPELDWKIRHRDNADRLIAGGVLGVAEVVKGLHSLSRIRPLPTKEREQYDNARHLLVHEVSVSMGVPLGLAEDYVDYALMPPVGTRFDLKPPPTPVMLPSRPKKKRPVAAEEGDGLDDLGLGDLGIDLGPADLEGALAAVGGEGAAAAGEGGEAEVPADGGEEAGGEAEEAAPTPTAGARAKPAARKAAATTQKHAAAKPAARAAAKAAAKKPARPAAASRPAPKPARPTKATRTRPSGKGKKK
jgi:RNA polymerase-interacting CarD/CdnL/TRCF family regulator